MGQAGWEFGAIGEATSPETDKIERETRFYITSLVWLAHQMGPAIRSHWAIENSLHWVMDMIFHDETNAASGFLTNDYRETDLIARLQQAEASIVPQWRR